MVVPSLPPVVAERRTEEAVSIWNRYFERDTQGRPMFSGAEFERFAGGGDKRSENQFTSDDFVAVSMLGVNVPAQAALRLLGKDRDEGGRLLSLIPANARLADAPEDVLGKGSPADTLWTLLWKHQGAKRSFRDGLGPTSTSKLLARKRPELFPVWDSVVERVTGHPRRGNWAWLRAELRRDDGALVDWLRLSAPPDLVDISILRLLDISILRLLDILIWMTGRSSAANR